MIGYYVHHRGRGHLHRMQSIARHLPERLTVLSSLSARAGHGVADWIELPADDSGTVFTEPTANGTMHWTPRHHEGLRARMALIAAWIAAANPSLVVVDVSVEVATMCRLMGVPTVVMAMRGDRSDRPHTLAYDAAHALVAPWTREFAAAGWHDSWQRKTFYAGAISRFGHLRPSVKTAHAGPPRVLVLWGDGGGADPTAPLAQAQTAATDWQWRFAGGGGGRRVDKDAVWDLLQWADVALTHGGQNAVAEVAASRTPAIVIAQSRPHGEQHATAAALDKAGVAIGLADWPASRQWPALLNRALAHGGGQWHRWAPPDGARRTAEFLAETAGTIR